MTDKICVLNDEIPCDCPAGRTCLHIDVPATPSWREVYTPPFMAILLVASIGILGMAGALAVNEMHRLERVLAQEARR